MQTRKSLDTICSALCYAIGIEPPTTAATPNDDIKNFIDSTLNTKKADRMFMRNGLMKNIQII